MKNRSKLIIYPQFQIKVLAIQLGTLIVCLGGVALAAFVSYQNLNAEGARAGLNPSHMYFQFVNYQYKLLFQSLLLAFIGGVTFSTLAFLVVSNKLAGPIVRLKKLMEETTKNPSHEIEIQFRKGDFFQELAQAVNQAFRALRKGPKQ